MKLTKSLLTLVLAFVCVFALFGCGLSQSDADKINEKAEAGEHYTYDEIIKKYGEPTINLTVAKIGVASWIEGVTEEEYNEKGAEAFEGSKVLVVTFNLQGKASTAVFKEFTKEDAK